ncbi:MAG TPA: PIG-L family deacetylase [Candidatus Dormibacteraeota bacterium]|nr:PIG-L family deacetylase [Candidatus Dormibacteraeota bacterium]
MLAVFPHPDDEAVTCGGTLGRLARASCHVTLVLLTRGERGGATGEPSARLAALRTAEAQRAAAALGVARLVQHDLGDGALRSQRRRLDEVLADVMERQAPDLVITYDRAGLYGHEDHVACSQAVTDLCRTRFPAVTLWYTALPRRLGARVALDESLRDRRAVPTHRVCVRGGMVAKIRAWYVYRSQRRALRAGLPPLVPAWVLLSMLPFEHFMEASPAQRSAERRAGDADGGGAEQGGRAQHEAEAGARGQQQGARDRRVERGHSGAQQRQGDR